MRIVGRAAVALSGLAVLVQIVYPLVHGSTKTACTAISVVAFFAASLLHAISVGGVRAAAALIGVCVFGGLIVEAVGTRTGWPFGRYEYAHTLGWEVFGVPIVVALAWAMMGWPALLAARRAGSILVGAAILTTWDLFLDPQMVRDGHWRWAPTRWPKLHGIPLSNALGWFVVAALMMAVLDRLVHADASLTALPAAMLGWTWFSETLGHLVFFHRPSVGVVGAMAMAAALGPVLRRPVARPGLRGPVARPVLLTPVLRGPVRPLARPVAWHLERVFGRKHSNQMPQVDPNATQRSGRRDGE